MSKGDPNGWLPWCFLVRRAASRTRVRVFGRPPAPPAWPFSPRPPEQPGAAPARRSASSTGPPDPFFGDPNPRFPRAKNRAPDFLVLGSSPVKKGSNVQEYEKRVNEKMGMSAEQTPIKTMVRALLVSFTAN